MFSSYQKQLFPLARSIPMTRVLTDNSDRFLLVKFMDPNTGLDCDINVNDQLGAINSDLLRTYCDVSPVLRTMIRVIKGWAKPLGLNNPTGRGGGGMTFSSYTLTLMTVAFLQSLKQAPLLQVGFPPLEKDAERDIFWVRTKDKGSLRCDIRYHRDRGATMAPSILMTADELLPLWFEFWANKFDYKKSMVCIKDGAFQPRPHERKPLVQNKSNTKSKVSSNTSDITTGVITHPASSEDTVNYLNANHHPVDRNALGNSVASSSKQQSEESLELPPTEEVSIFSDDKPFCVVDPFIRTKNVAGNINQRNLRRFVVECKRAIAMLRLNGTIDDIAPESGADSDFVGQTVSPRKKNKRRRARGPLKSSAANIPRS
jgi:hypothetical protein